MQNRIITFGRRHFQNNFIVYFVLSVVFIVGIIIGSILISRLELEHNYNIVSYFSWILDYIDKGEGISVNVFKASMLSNIRFSFIIWALGFIALGIIIIPIIIGIKGLSIGLIVGFLVKKFGIRGFTFAILGLLPYYLIILPGVLAIGSLGLSNSISNRKKNKKIYRINHNDATNYSILILLFLLVISIGSFVESFITPYFIQLTSFNL